MTFKPGQSGNMAGNPNPKLWQQAIKRAIVRSGKDKIDYSALDEVADALLMSAKSGDIAAMKELGDRLDGKANQSVDMNVSVTPSANVFPIQPVIEHEPRLPIASEAVDGVH